MPDDLDRTFFALADPTRRRILELLEAREPRSTNELARAFPLSRWAVMKHLEALREARLVQTLPQGRRRLHFVDRRRLREPAAWLTRHALQG